MRPPGDERAASRSLGAAWCLLLMLLMLVEELQTCKTEDRLSGPAVVPLVYVESQSRNDPKV